MKRVQAFIFLLMNRVCKIFGLHFIFENNKGVKCFNQSLNSAYFGTLEVVEKIEVNPENLFLGFDGLKDTYTLIDKPLKDSPHTDFVKQLYINNNNYKKTDYFQRFVSGTIDLRYNQLPVLYNFKKMFKVKVEKIQKDQYNTVFVSRINNRLYILDGKHTAALLSIMNKQINCSVLKDPYKHPFFKLLYLKMKRNENDFSKNIKFLKDSLNSNDDH